ncbi:low molecular weight phosphatase family protein [Microbulbifer agarilyticus]|uniref:Low molecular weight phosphatase family protein n=1 Tax=Microbulbifer agarilyticus TaxID=260552 RepID=A0A1Q2M4I9_9GAMM|nr:arsenate reductase ArsC [Microbulbifer agarilyticus]AQQ67643.1 low molecular weight phosphatase family protein [Microbulbifer agarilyticus]
MKVLYICTHNRCRSILSEAVTNSLGQEHIEARSAGSQPSGAVHPLSIKYLKERGIETDSLRSQSWDDFEEWAPDLVVTVCDSAAGESCPVWFGNSAKVHWGLEDPSKLEGSEDEIERAFNQTIDIIQQRVEQMLEQGLHKKSGTALQEAMQALADGEQ